MAVNHLKTAQTYIEKKRTTPLTLLTSLCSVMVQCIDASYRLLKAPLSEEDCIANYCSNNDYQHEKTVKSKSHFLFWLSWNSLLSLYIIYLVRKLETYFYFYSPSSAF